MFVPELYIVTVTGSNVFSGRSLLSKQNAEMSKHDQNILFHTNTVIPLKTSQQAHTRLVTTLDLCHSGINTRPLPRYPRNLSVILQLTQPPPTLYS